MCNRVMAFSILQIFFKPSTLSSPIASGFPSRRPFHEGKGQQHDARWSRDRPPRHVCRGPGRGLLLRRFDRMRGRESEGAGLLGQGMNPGVGRSVSCHQLPLVDRGDMVIMSTLLERVLSPPSPLSPWAYSPRPFLYVIITFCLCFKNLSDPRPDAPGELAIQGGICSEVAWQAQ